MNAKTATNASFTDGVTADQLQAIKNWLKIGEHRKDNQSADWAGYVVGKVLDLGTSKEMMKLTTSAGSRGCWMHG
jgi:hypothetical protein